MVAAKECDASYKDLDHEDEHTGQDNHLVVVVEEVVVALDVDHTHDFQDDEGNGKYEDKMVGGRTDGCSIPVVSALLQMNLEKSSVYDEQQPQ